MKKAGCVIFLVVFQLTFLNAQSDKEAFDMIDLQFSATQVKSNFDSLTFNYYDDAIETHHFYSHFNLKSPQTLYGAELNLLGYTVPNGIYWSGFGLSAHFGQHMVASNMYSGVGYVFRLNEKLDFTPFVTLGCGRVAYMMEDYQNSTGENVIVRYQTLEGNVTARLVRNSFVVTPQAALDYTFHTDFAIRLTAGYRFDVSGYEVVKFIEDKSHSTSVQARAWSRTIPAHQAMEQNGQAIYQPIFNMNGFMLSAGIIWVLKI